MSVSPSTTEYASISSTGHSKIQQPRGQQHKQRPKVYICVLEPAYFKVPQVPPGGALPIPGASLLQQHDETSCWEFVR